MHIFEAETDFCINSYGLCSVKQVIGRNSIWIQTAMLMLTTVNSIAAQGCVITIVCSEIVRRCVGDPNANDYVRLFAFRPPSNIALLAFGLLNTLCQIRSE